MSTPFGALVTSVSSPVGAFSIGTICVAFGTARLPSTADSFGRRTNAAICPHALAGDTRTLGCPSKNSLTADTRYVGYEFPDHGSVQLVWFAGTVNLVSIPLT